jgi:hypothetical protein
MSRFHLKIIAAFSLLLLIFSCKSRGVVDQMVGSKPERHVWSKWRQKREMKNKTAYNPYLEKKAKDKPSGIQARENKKLIKQGKRAVRREKRKLRRTKGAYQKVKTK